MRTTIFAIALCAATTIAAPTRSRRTLTSNVPATPSKEVSVLEEVVVHVEQILNSAEPAESKVQDILDTIVHDIQGRDVEKREEEDPLETALEDVENILDGDESTKSKITDVSPGPHLDFHSAIETNSPPRSSTNSSQ